MGLWNIHYNGDKYIIVAGHLELIPPSMGLWNIYYNGGKYIIVAGHLELIPPSMGLWNIHYNGGQVYNSSWPPGTNTTQYGAVEYILQ